MFVMVRPLKCLPGRLLGPDSRMKVEVCLLNASTVPRVCVTITIALGFSSIRKVKSPAGLENLESS
jgi:hypothetical protein